MAWYLLCDYWPSPEMSESFLQNSVMPAKAGKLKNSNRTLLRKMFIKAGLKPKKLNKDAWTDIYDVSGSLDGAKTLEVVFTKTDGRFAMGEYTFPSFMNANQVQGIIELVSNKYGKPDDIEGNLALGPVKAIWRAGQMRIFVSRGWPDTTTYLTYVELENKAIVESEVEAYKYNKSHSKFELQKNAV